MTLQEAVKETKNFIKIEAEQAGVDPEEIMRELKEELEVKEFVEATR
ncbi:hypothetical protein KGY79_13835 [Candidatus Bipolaricaulota bacterium]|nr:hypothetical protein [Candidatus Bipolaricaulota bacterium]